MKIGDTYYIFVGGKDNELNEGIIIVLKSKSLDHFEYAFTIGPFYELGDMADAHHILESMIKMSYLFQDVIHIEEIMILRISIAVSLSLVISTLLKARCTWTLLKK